MAYNYTDAVVSLKGITPTDKLVLLHLAEHADKETGECWPGFGRLADYTGLTRRTVIYSINRLEKLGFITVTSPTPTRKTNTYVVRMDKLVAASVTSPTKKKRKYTRKEQVASDMCCSEFPDCICDEQEQIEFLDDDLVLPS
jgi:pyocin large subunit-like protein